MAMVNVEIKVPTQADLQLKPIGLVQRAVAAWHCSAFSKLSQLLCHGDSTINIVSCLLLLHYCYQVKLHRDVVDLELQSFDTNQ